MVGLQISWIAPEVWIGIREDISERGRSLSGLTRCLHHIVVIILGPETVRVEIFEDISTTHECGHPVAEILLSW